MKRVKSLLIVLVIVVTCISCEEDDITCLRVSGDIVTQKRTIESFKSIFFNNVGNLYISQGNETKLWAKGQENVVDAVEAEVIEGELRISLDKCFNGEDFQLDLFITSPDFEKIVMAGTGLLASQTTINVNQLEIIHSGVTRSFEMDIKADTLITELLGSGTISYEGEVNHHNMLISGVGDIKSYGMSGKSVKITHNGNGDAFVNVSEMLQVILNSNGNVYYKGTPKIEKEGNGPGAVINDN